MKHIYTSKKIEKDGNVYYDEQENLTWSILLTRQKTILEKRACDEYWHGLNILQLPNDYIPQHQDINRVLLDHTQWQLSPVPAFITLNEFFFMLASRKFPIATFIRKRADLDYIDQPDLFHEIIGHCPLLLNKPYADFLQSYGKLSLNQSSQIQKYLGRLFFFTIEVGLISTSNILKIYGGGILSSSSESIYALESTIPERKMFNFDEILNSKYDLKELQKKYFIIENFEMLYELKKIIERKLIQ